VVQLPDALTKKSAVLTPAKFLLSDPQRNPSAVFAKVVLASDTHLDQTRSSLKESKWRVLLILSLQDFNDAEFAHLQSKLKGGESRMFNPSDRIVEFPHLSVSITGYQWFDDTCLTWKRVKGNRFSLRYSLGFCKVEDFKWRKRFFLLFKEIIKDFCGSLVASVPN
jgi:hypothetical protein